MRARAAFCDVTPRGRAVQLAGYAGRPPATEVLDRIEISAVLLEDGERRCLIFSFDLMGVGAELQDAILARLSRHGFKPSEVMCLASHTHFAPATDRACAPLGPPDDRFISDAADAAEGLVRRLLQAEPLEIRLDVKGGALDHAINRRRYWPLPTLNRTYGLRFSCIAMAPEPNGAADQRATVILLRRADGDAVIAAIWHYACHPTAVVPDNAVSADFPGAVRRALRQQFGDVPCLFVQGFCGDISPKMVRAPSPLSRRLRGLARLLITGPTFPPSTPEDYIRWRESLAASVVRIVQSPTDETQVTGAVATGLADVALSSFFQGRTPDKPLTVQIVRLGAIELMALSAEVTMEWQPILESKIAPREGRLRLYAGYLGTLYGYLPTPDQIKEGGYEVTGFQHLFGLSGRFDAEKIVPMVVGCVKRAIDDLERALQG